MTPPLHTPAIGLSIVQKIMHADNNNNGDEGPSMLNSIATNNHDDDDDDMGLPTTKPISNCVLFPDGNDCSEQPFRILLRGPRKSGKSSIAMDLAQAVAANSPCRCHQQPSLCTCKAVVLFVPLHRCHDQPQQQSPVDDFPVPCAALPPSAVSNLSNDEDTGDGTIQQQITIQPTQDTIASWDLNALRRIEVHHVTSARDVMKYLLTVHNRPLDEQPSEGFLLDDIDMIIAGSAQQNEAFVHPKAMQLLAVVVDAANAMARQHHSSPVVLATTKLNMSIPLMNMYCNLTELPTFLDTAVQNTAPFGHETITSSWKASITEMTAQMNPVRRAVMYYHTKNQRHDIQIRWAKHSEIQQ